MVAPSRDTMSASCRPDRSPTVPPVTLATMAAAATYSGNTNQKRMAVGLRIDNSCSGWAACPPRTVISGDWPAKNGVPEVPA